ncbi:MAG: 30S ribosome-binding factor RbfA [Holosporaceae bacterium]|nr:30S ribosome-binding factor RbfA [Holosporaceae bacterium]
MKRKDSGRPNRVAAEIKKTLSEFLLRNSFADEKIDSAFISIVDATVSPCLQHAKIYVASLSPNISNDECLEFLEKHTPRLRHCIGTEIRLKFTPTLSFFIDDSFDRVNKIESLLKSASNGSKI